MLSLALERNTARKGDPLRESGFTLIELLVSLTILAILAAMAIPGLRAAFDRADRVVCLSNLRQMGQAMSEFESDYGHYPAAEWPVRDGAGRVVERRRWYHSIAPYLDSSPAAWSSGQGRVQLDAATGGSVGFVLPSEDDRDQSVFPEVLRCPRCKGWDVGRNGSYGYNHQYLGDARLLGTEDDGQPVYRRFPVSRTQIEVPSSTVVLLDSAGTGEGPYRSVRSPAAGAIGNHAFTVDPPILPPRGPAGAVLGSDSPVPGVGTQNLISRPAGRHRGGCCALFADGRVEWLPLRELLKDDALFNGTGRASSR